VVRLTFVIPVRLLDLVEISLELSGGMSTHGNIGDSMNRSYLSRRKLKTNQFCNIREECLYDTDGKLDILMKRQYLKSMELNSFMICSKSCEEGKIADNN
jgi:hypothetical protein